jgi:hypothetical protein
MILYFAFERGLVLLECEPTDMAIHNMESVSSEATCSECSMYLPLEDNMLGDKQGRPE